MHQTRSENVCSEPFDLEKKGKDYAFRRQFREKPSIIPAAQVPCDLHAVVNFACQL